MIDVKAGRVGCGWRGRDKPGKVRTDYIALAKCHATVCHSCLTGRYLGVHFSSRLPAGLVQLESFHAKKPRYEKTAIIPPLAKAVGFAVRGKPIEP